MFLLNGAGYNKKERKIPTTREEVEDLIVDCFNSCAERDIFTGRLFSFVLNQ